ncbi:Fe-S cluster assembly protein SufD [Oscillatoria sp. FACHB-1407]|uniref:Fe-S cluster assembly protein SufD n=1 Tax=Oscillatoria sp. FACHB-1407 TaxID=2692847 RepID=UPI001685E7FD|nr:Fe-S cluster assembly protein SufD [Oscillatoria sp. FACHB-1407]MBD2464708.1 Fe-S cluster assembly protein SufD [Oscillatoria sp. FACHB-1407]
MTIQTSGVATVQRGDERAAYLQSLLALRPTINSPSLQPETQPWLQSLRDSAAARVQELAIPSTRDEEWRFTDLSPLVQTSFRVGDRSPHITDIEAFKLPEAECRLVFIDGIFAPELSTPVAQAGMVAGNLIGGQYTQPLQHYLGKQSGTEEVFTALNTASFQDGAVIWVSKNQSIEQPIHLLFISTSQADSTISHPRCLVVAEANSRATVLEEYVSLDHGGYFTNPVTEIWLAENAEVNHTRVQRDNQAAFHIGKTAVSQARDSRYTCNAVSLGGKLSRHNLEIYQTGEQTFTALNGLTMIRGEQLSDTHSAIALTKPYGSTRQLHKCIIDDRAHAVFNGKVFVPKAAQLTDAGQLNRNLLLSSKARVDTKPQLEIVADNVKCTHGATVGQLDADEIFYLQSRGIDADTARNLLIYAFAYEILEQIPSSALQKTLAQLISN